MGNRRIVKSKTFLRLPKVSANHVLKIVDVNRCMRVESIWIVHRDEPARHVPFVPARTVIGLTKIVWRLIVFAEVTDIRFRI